MSRLSDILSPFQALRPFVVLALTLVLPIDGNAQTKDKSQYSKATGQVARTPKVDESDLPVTIEAEEMTGRPDREVNLDNNVEIVRGQTTLTSDRAIFRQEENEVEAFGNVRIERFGDVYIGDAAEMNLDTSVGTVYNAEYRLAQSKAQGKAERFNTLSEDRSRIVNGTYSTCEGAEPDWYLKSKSLDIDAATNTGLAKDSVVYFKDVPILPLPVMSFPTSGDRKSGVLPPTIGMTSKNGLEVIVPYYFNLAPDYDLTVYPKLISRRGLQLGLDGRYLERTFSGETKIEVLPNDIERGTTRYSITSVHTHNFAPEWTYSWNFNQASDRNYPDDFGNSIATSSQRLLTREANLTYSNDTFGSTNLRVSDYQLLQDLASPITRPHSRLPQLTYHVDRTDVSGFDWAFDADATRFSLPDSDLFARSASDLSRATGNRLVMKQQISYPIQTQGYFIKPKFQMNETKYELDYFEPNGTPVTSLSRVVPTFSLDSGLVYERDSSFMGAPMTQTLEPRLFYVYTPYRDQSNFPNFDSAETTFGYAQLFSENRFSGSDRIADANHLTAALTSRYIEPSGAERMRFMIGERFYFHDQQVGLDGNLTTSNNRRSDLLLSVGGRLTRTVTIDSLVQYNLDSQRTYSANYSVQWKPLPKHVFNAGYRYTRNTLENSTDPLGNGLEQLAFSGQWPLGGNWYLVGQWNYSLPQSKAVENLVGFEYNAGCWIWRMATQRYLTSSVESTTALFFQLQLNGLSRIGTDPMQALRKTIPGYEPLIDTESQATSSTQLGVSSNSDSPVPVSQ